MLAAHAKRVQCRHRRKIEAHRENSEHGWLADHHLSRYLEAIGKIVVRILHSRHVGRPSRRPCTVPIYAHGVDAASPGVPPPALKIGRHKKMTISEAEFIAALSNQPKDKSWLTARSSVNGSALMTGSSAKKHDKAAA